MENKEERIEKLNAAIDAAKKSLLMASAILIELKSDVSSLKEMYQMLDQQQKRTNDGNESK